MAELAIFGEKKSITEWSQDPRCQVSYATLRMRLSRGWDPERALTEGSNLLSEQKLTIRGKTRTIAEWSRHPRCTVTKVCIRQRLERGIPPKDAVFGDGQRDPESLARLEAWGESKTFAEWVEDPRCDIDINTLRNRIRLEWTPEDAVGTPLKVRYYEAFGESLTLAQWSKHPRCECSYSALRRRIHQGLDIVTALTTLPRGKTSSRS